MTALGQFNQFPSHLPDALPSMPLPRLPYPPYLYKPSRGTIQMCIFILLLSSISTLRSAMPLTRAALKRKLLGIKPAGSTSHVPSNPLPSAPPLSGIRSRITPEIKKKLLQFWDPDTLEWVIDNEKLTLGELLEMGIDLFPHIEEDAIDWAELEKSSSEDEEFATPGPRDVYGVPLGTCEVCQKQDVGTRLPSCWHCGKRAHVSCLQWIAREDPRKAGHFLWQCPPHPRVWFLEG